MDKDRARARAQLFRPGDGMIPPHIAGREREMDVLLCMLDCLKEGQPPASNAALHGPRGLGKSVLLRKLQSEAASARPRVRAVLVSSRHLPDAASLHEATLGERQPAAEIERRERRVAGGASGFLSAQSGRTHESQFAGMSMFRWTSELAQSCRERPLLFMVDEAHVLDLDVAQLLLNASQIIRGEDAPFALVLAGTPGLQSHLAKAESSFWDRLADGNLRLGLLSRAESVEALRVPFSHPELGLPFEDGALDEMAKRSDGFPYFVQIWGKQAEMAARREGGDVDGALAKRIAPSVEAMRNDFYNLRVVELRKENLLQATQALARHFQGQDASMSWEDAERVLAPLAPGGDGKRALETLQLLGAITADGWRAWPSVPSFMQHVLGQGA